MVPLLLYQIFSVWRSFVIHSLQRNELVEAIQALASLSDKRHNEVMERLDNVTFIVMQMRDELVSMNANYKGHDQRIERLEGAVFPQT